VIQAPLRPDWRREVASRAAVPVDGASLAVVRIVYGLVGVLVAVRTAANGWVESLYAGPSHHFTYPGFRWVAPPGIGGTHLLLTVLGVAAICVALGWRYRIALVVFLVAFVWLELVEVTTYLNHYWFVTLFGLLLLALPAATCWSLDARRQPQADVVPLGAIWLVRVQVAVVYVFAGLAKLNTGSRLDPIWRSWGLGSTSRGSPSARAGPARRSTASSFLRCAGSAPDPSRGAHSSCSTWSRGACSRSACSRG
jgi:hypothetical protein